ncbi:periplasmic heavy metal sensor [Thalassospira mesophila]|uniref:Heavy-metal resistance n=1 Tax=Thalassospira mesophila TaxID=1293891 RepID=A0A1Y2KXE6_9PROT|nr:periplasmic heavy metal sensor [Thalassospira mesophila]OSQ37028.1 hypothetical protein TMES_16430 [Thalassospira mesophila]
MINDRRKPTSTAMLLMASMALNLFILGALAGNYFAGNGSILPFERQAPQFDDRHPGPPPLRMMKRLRESLSPQGQDIFDQEMGPVMDLIAKNREAGLFQHMAKVLLKEHPEDSEITNTFHLFAETVSGEISTVLDHMARMAIRLSPDDRYQLAINTPPLSRPGPPPGP